MGLSRLTVDNALRRLRKTHRSALPRHATVLRGRGSLVADDLLFDVARRPIAIAAIAAPADHHQPQHKPGLRPYREEHVFRCHRRRPPPLPAGGVGWASAPLAARTQTAATTKRTTTDLRFDISDLFRFSYSLLWYFYPRIFIRCSTYIVLARVRKRNRSSLLADQFERCPKARILVVGHRPANAERLLAQFAVGQGVGEADAGMLGRFEPDHGLGRHETVHLIAVAADPARRLQ